MHVQLRAYKLERLHTHRIHCSPTYCARECANVKMLAKVVNPHAAACVDRVCKAHHAKLAPRRAKEVRSRHHCA
eukprot:3676383-Pleurochrysis_carterae.AAC.1